MVPLTPAAGVGSGVSMTPSLYAALHAHVSSRVMVVIVTCAMCEIDDSASPRKPNVAISCKSSNFLSLDVVKRSQTIDKSSF